ncbi:hypothetical protein QO010_004177 [Caulobacter ginsengisoli]|uniref:Uncharacterized protein n=1 Tax=Caulobacter ginsengisoli TaxID=400775 RepID=A0ABU0IWJ6_9CAUL|nr:hypothetical protein [Caulobacter ginsengisoli]MDQ0466384.1 hypothetical protein [Caulobacter ginsengisoli]
MNRLHRLAALALAAALALPHAALAAPGDSECIWRNLQGDGLNAYLAAAESNSATPNPTDFISIEQLSTALDTCKIADKDVGAAGGAFGAFTQRKVAESALLKSSGASPTVLDKAWKRIDPALARQVGVAIAQSKFDPAAQKQLEQAVAQFQADFTQPLEEKMAARYVLARADQEYLETLF